jgi:sorting nexin-27
MYYFQEAERLEPSEEQANYNCVDYSEKRSLPISIPDYHYVERDGERFAVSYLSVNDCIILEYC